MKFKNTIWVLLMLFGFSQAQAQLRKSYFSVGASLGATNYKGDLDDNFALKFTKPGFGAVLNYNFAPHMIVRLGFTQGWIGASDNKSKPTSLNAADYNGRQWRNLSFKSHLTEFSAVLVYEFFATSRTYKYRPIWSPYVFAGAAVFNYAPKAELNGKTYNLHDYGTEGQLLVGVPGTPKQYSLTQFSIPLGVGVRYTLSKRLDLRLEMGVRKCFTDYLDDVSDRYADPQKMLAQMGETAMLLSDRSGYTKFGADYTNSGYRSNDVRGFKNQDDWYVYTGFIVSYILDKGERCPKFK